MALIECKECKHQVSDTAKICPSCGKQMPKKLSIIHWTGIVLFGLIIFGALVGHNNSQQASTRTSTSTELIVQEQVVDVKIAQILSDYKGNEVSADNTY